MVRKVLERMSRDTAETVQFFESESSAREWLNAQIALANSAVLR